MSRLAHEARLRRKVRERAHDAYRVERTQKDDDAEERDARSTRCQCCGRVVPARTSHVAADGRLTCRSPWSPSRRPGAAAQGGPQVEGGEALRPPHGEADDDC